MNIAELNIFLQRHRVTLLGADVGLEPLEDLRPYSTLILKTRIMRILLVVHRSLSMRTGKLDIISDKLILYVQQARTLNL